MEAGRIFLYLISAVEPLMPVMIFTALATLVVTVVLDFAGRDAWFDQPQFKILGEFYCLSGYDSYRLAISWVRLLMTAYYIVTFRELETVNFVAYMLVGLLYVLDFKSIRRIPRNLVMMLIVSAGLFAVNIVCGYIKTLVVFDIKAWVIYVFMGIFMCLFAFYLFLQEVEDISSDRRIAPEKEYERTVKES